MANRKDSDTSLINPAYRASISVDTPFKKALCQPVFLFRILKTQKSRCLDTKLILNSYTKS